MARCMTSERESELSGVMESLVEQTRLLEERRATVDRQTTELTATLDELSADRERLHADRLAFNSERQTFAEELVRINNINKIHDRCASSYRAVQKTDNAVLILR